MYEHYVVQRLHNNITIFIFTDQNIYAINAQNNYTYF